MCSMFQMLFANNARVSNGQLIITQNYFADDIFNLPSLNMSIP